MYSYRVPAAFNERVVLAGERIVNPFSSEILILDLQCCFGELVDGEG